MIALSPVLLDHEVRLVLTYQPSAPMLSSCLEFNSPSKDCVVHALRCLHGMEHRRCEKILGDVVDCTLRTPSAAEPALSYVLIDLCLGNIDHDPPAADEQGRSPSLAAPLSDRQEGQAERDPRAGCRARPRSDQPTADGPQARPSQQGQSIAIT